MFQHQGKTPPRGLATVKFDFVIKPLRFATLIQFLVVFTGCASLPDHLWALQATEGKPENQASPAPEPADPTGQKAAGPAKPPPAVYTHTPPQAPKAPAIKPGRFIWRPELSPQGPVVVVISIPEQVAYVYRNGVRIGVSSVSTGRRGYETPTGVFPILDKKREYTSNLYDDAPMPFMERLTWDGVALHAGRIPGYPASHGCVRLPHQFAKLLFGVTRIGTPVVVANHHITSDQVLSPGWLPPVVAAAAETPATEPTAGAYFWQPELAPEGRVSVVLSRADRRLYVYRKDVLIGRADVQINDPDKPLGSNLFTLLEGNPEPGKTAQAATTVADDPPARRWMAVSLPAKGVKGLNYDEVASRLQAPPRFAQLVYDILTPGATVITTDRPVPREKAALPEMVVMTEPRPQDSAGN